MAPPQILEAEHACGVSHVHGAATRARLHTVKYAICFFGLSQRSVQCMSLTSKYLPCINVVGVREAKKNTRSRVLLLSLARLCVSRHISLPCDAVCVCVCVCAVCESVHEHVCVRAGRSVI